MEQANDQQSPEPKNKKPSPPAAGGPTEEKPVADPVPAASEEAVWPPESLAEPPEESQHDIVIGDEPAEGAAAAAAETAPAGSDTPQDEEPAPAATAAEPAEPVEPEAPVESTAQAESTEPPAAMESAEQADVAEAAEPADAAEPAVASQGPESSPSEQEVQEVLTALDERRAALAALLFTADRPRPAAVQPAVAAYGDALRATAQAGRTASDETAWLLEEAGRAHRAALESERQRFEQTTTEIRGAIDQYESFFQRLAALTEELAGEVARLEQDDPRLESAPEELRSRLANYRKGIEIIHRMFSRTADRKKQLSQEPPAALKAEMDLPEAPAELEEVPAFAERVSRVFHDLRDANYHAGADARKHADECRNAVFATARQLVSAVDGIDSGLANQPQTRESLAEFEKDDSLAALLDDWLAAYHRVDEQVSRFLADVGIETHTVPPGTRFDPETMEPQAAVANPELNDEDVAAVVRRGFSLQGEQIRPILVDVVRNG